MCRRRDSARYWGCRRSCLRPARREDHNRTGQAGPAFPKIRRKQPPWVPSRDALRHSGGRRRPWRLPRPLASRSSPAKPRHRKSVRRRFQKTRADTRRTWPLHRICMRVRRQYSRNRCNCGAPLYSGSAESLKRVRRRERSGCKGRKLPPGPHGRGNSWSHRPPHRAGFPWTSRCPFRRPSFCSRCRRERKRRRPSAANIPQPPSVHRATASAARARIPPTESAPPAFATGDPHSLSFSCAPDRVRPR